MGRSNAFVWWQNRPQGSHRHRSGDILVVIRDGSPFISRRSDGLTPVWGWHGRDRPITIRRKNRDGIRGGLNGMKALQYESFPTRVIICNLQYRPGGTMRLGRDKPSGIRFAVVVSTRVARHSRELLRLIVVLKESRGLRPIGFGGVSRKRLRLPRVEFRSSDDVQYAELADVRNNPSRQGHQSTHRGRHAAILEEVPVTVRGVQMNPEAGSVKEGHDGRYD